MVGTGGGGIVFVKVLDPFFGRRRCRHFFAKKLFSNQVWGRKWRRCTTTIFLRPSIFHPQPKKKPQKMALCTKKSRVTFRRTVVSPWSLA